MKYEGSLLKVIRSTDANARHWNKRAQELWTKERMKKLRAKARVLEIQRRVDEARALYAEFNFAPLEKRKCANRRLLNYWS